VELHPGAWQELTAATVSGKRIQWAAIAAETAAMAELYETWRAAEASSGYRVEALLDYLENPGSAKKSVPRTRGMNETGTQKRGTKKGSATKNSGTKSGGRATPGKKKAHD